MTEEQIAALAQLFPKGYVVVAVTDQGMREIYAHNPLSIKGLEKAFVEIAAIEGTAWYT